MRAFGALPIAGPQKNLAVFLTSLAMKLVNRHNLERLAQAG